MRREHSGNRTFVPAAPVDLSVGPGESPILTEYPALLAEGRPAAAENELQSPLCALGPSPKALSALGQVQYDQGKYEDAASTYRSLLELEPDDLLGHLRLAWCLDKLAVWADAVSEFEKALDLAPDSFDARLGYGISLLRLKRPGDALVEFDRCLSAQPTSQPALLGKAAALDGLGQSDAAKLLYRSVVQQRPELQNNDAEALPAEVGGEWGTFWPSEEPFSELAIEQLASKAFAAENFASAAKHCKELVRHNPDHFEGWYNLGVAQQTNARSEEAVSAYRNAVRLRPDCAEAYLNLGMILHSRGDVQKACECYRCALEVAPNLETALWNMALLHEELEELEEAEDLLERLTKNAPDQADVWFRLGHVRMRRGNHGGAAGAFEHCLELRNSWEEANINLGIAYWESGRLSDASSAFHAVLALDPDHRDALQGAASIALGGRNRMSALPLLERQVQLDDPSPEAYYNCALLHEERGESDTAMKLYEESLKLRPDFPEALVNLGNVHLDCDDQPSASACFDGALQLPPDVA